VWMCWCSDAVRAVRRFGTPRERERERESFRSAKPDVVDGRPNVSLQRPAVIYPAAEPLSFTRYLCERLVLGDAGEGWSRTRDLLIGSPTLRRSASGYDSPYFTLQW